MEQSRDRVWLQHMLDHAREATSMVAGRAEADLRADRMLELALVRLVEVVGEAATRISPNTPGSHPEIPWRVLVGMRNRLIHGYDRISHDVLWDTVTKDLPTLVAQLEQIVS